MQTLMMELAQCRSPYGERGLKSSINPPNCQCQGRSPYGERGLKFMSQSSKDIDSLSLSLRRAWIEIENPNGHQQRVRVALLTESVD